VNRCVLDASAILAIVLQEPGCALLTAPGFPEGIASVVNIAEAQARLVKLGTPAREAWESALSIVGQAYTFDEEQGRLSGTLVDQARPLGLSLGDRACLALGITMNLPVYTGDRIWKKLSLNIPVHLIR
jgi:ribonuclease VapC